MLSVFVHAAIITVPSVKTFIQSDGVDLKKSPKSNGSIQLRFIKSKNEILDRPPENKKKVGLDGRSNDLNHEIKLENGLKIEYPHLAQVNGIQGNVGIVVVISGNGSLLSSRVSKSSGHKILDFEALKSIQKAKFKSRIVNGKNVIGELEIMIKFKL